MGQKNRTARIVTRLAGSFLNAASRIFRLNNGLTVFLFHEVTDTPSEFLKSSGMWVSKEVFQLQVDWILKNFEVIPVANLLSGVKLPRNAALITFDDSWEGMVDAIEMYLLPSETPVCLFLNFGTIIDGVDIAAAAQYFPFTETKFKTNTNQLLNATKSLPEEKFKSFLDFQGSIAKMESIKKLAANPSVTISSHLFHHLDANQLSDEEFKSQFHQNDNWIRSFGEQEGRIFFAFPFGTPELNFQEKHIQMLNDQGVRHCFSGTGRRLRKFHTLPHLIPRVHFSPEDRYIGNIWWACYKNQILRR